MKQNFVVVTQFKRAQILFLHSFFFVSYPISIHFLFLLSRGGMLCRAQVLLCKTVKMVAQRLGVASLSTQRSSTSERRQELEDSGAVRPSRRRFDGFNTKGRSERVRKIISRLNLRDPALRDKISHLPLREQLDVVRELWNRTRAKRLSKRSNGLEKFPSARFEKSYYFREEDLEEQSTLGRGPGGQATNRRMQTVILRHKPSGLVVKFSKFPSLWLNRRAARELMNLRLEEKLIGARSVLGMQKLTKERSALRKRSRRSSLVRFAEKVERSEAETASVDFFGFLSGASSLPEAVIHQMSEACPTAIDSSRSELFIGDLFNAQCHNWWPLLERQFSRDGQLPMFFRLVFPSVPQMEDADLGDFVGPLTREQTTAVAEITRCRQSPQVLEHVRMALRCVVETFGLVLRQKTDPTTKVARLVLEKDGMSWVENRCRMLLDATVGKPLPPDARVSPLAQALFPHIFRSLTLLHMVPEAAAVKRFFVAESQLNRKNALVGCPLSISDGASEQSCCWAARLVKNFCPFRKHSGVP